MGTPILDNQNVNLHVEFNDSATGEIVAPGALPGPVTWTSSDGSLMTLSPSGENDTVCVGVTVPGASGSVKVTCTLGNVVASKDFDLTVAPALPAMTAEVIIDSIVQK